MSIPKPTLPSNNSVSGISKTTQSGFSLRLQKPNTVVANDRHNKPANAQKPPLEASSTRLGRRSVTAAGVVPALPIPSNVPIVPIDPVASIPSTLSHTATSSLLSTTSAVPPPVLHRPMAVFETVTNHGLVEVRNIPLPIVTSSSSSSSSKTISPMVSNLTNLSGEYMPSYGCSFISKYKQICRLGSGTYGTVYLSVDKLTGLAWAVKKLQISTSEAGFHYTALREIAVLKACPHPNILSIREVAVGRHPEHVFIVLDLCVTDLERLASNPLARLTLAQLKTYVLQLLTALAFLHRRFIVHRDLKPSNLLIDRDGVLRVADFGLTRFIAHPLPLLSPVVVTLWYRAPEILLGAEKYHAAIDMWSVGCIIAQLLIGYPLFQGETEIEVMEQIITAIGLPDESYLATMQGSVADYTRNILEKQKAWKIAKEKTKKRNHDINHSQVANSLRTKKSGFENTYSLNTNDCLQQQSAEITENDKYRLEDQEEYDDSDGEDEGAFYAFSPCDGYDEDDTEYSEDEVGDKEKYESRTSNHDGNTQTYSYITTHQGQEQNNDSYQSLHSDRHIFHDTLPPFHPLLSSVSISHSLEPSSPSSSFPASFSSDEEEEHVLGQEKEQQSAQEQEQEREQWQQPWQDHNQEQEQVQELYRPKFDNVVRKDQKNLGYRENSAELSHQGRFVGNPLQYQQSKQVARSELQPVDYPPPFLPPPPQHISYSSRSIVSNDTHPNKHSHGTSHNNWNQYNTSMHETEQENTKDYYDNTAINDEHPSGEYEFQQTQDQYTRAGVNDANHYHSNYDQLDMYGNGNGNGKYNSNAATQQNYEGYGTTNYENTISGRYVNDAIASNTGTYNTHDTYSTYDTYDAYDAYTQTSTSTSTHSSHSPSQDISVPFATFDMPSPLQPPNLRERLRDAGVSAAGCDFIQGLLRYDVGSRLSASLAFSQAWFFEEPKPLPPNAMPKYESKKHDRMVQDYLRSLQQEKEKEKEKEKKKEKEERKGVF